ncbi:hypothetical protein GcM3_011016 [Golovinomyces cichoracearum]|uniref:Uncharacterized protein n=1 Tax=Golovinomyces cichoracearum TaxID=62708 RepID=A0A420JA19_9PEZI|nr:hypothetical protein GcM3_011016 [Golovinomyces cichoracearum]
MIHGFLDVAGKAIIEVPWMLGQLKDQENGEAGLEARAVQLHLSQEILIIEYDLSLFSRTDAQKE